MLSQSIAGNGVLKSFTTNLSPWCSINFVNFYNNDQQTLSCFTFRKSDTLRFYVRIWNISYNLPRNSNKQNELVYLEEESRMVRILYDETVSNYGVVCYSSVEPNILLYSHYADKHRGMCLEFEVNNIENSNLKEVEYCTEFKRIAFSSENHGQKEEIEMILTSKSKLWECEKEYRQIFDFKNDYSNYLGGEVVFDNETNNFNSTDLLTV